jgi:hypothetical protein
LGKGRLQTLKQDHKRPSLSFKSPQRHSHQEIHLQETRPMVTWSLEAAPTGVGPAIRN